VGVRLSNRRFVVCDRLALLAFANRHWLHCSFAWQYENTYVFEPDGGRQNARSRRKTGREPGQNLAVPIIAEI